MPVATIAVLMTCHNRRECTVRCLHSLKRQSIDQGLRLFLTDDGSTDGTRDAVLDLWPEAVVLNGDGNLYWNQGMRKAWQAAAESDPDYFWLVNDDTIMEAFALEQLLSMIPSPEARLIAVGAVIDPTSGRQVYGGWRKRGRQKILAQGRVEDCDAMNANCALVPRAVFREMGMFHSAYTHAMGDFDYGMEARRRGIRVIQMARPVAFCLGNSDKGTWRDRSLGLKERFRRIISPKGLPPREWLVYTWRNEGWFWPLRFLSPYIRILLGG